MPNLIALSANPSVIPPQDVAGRYVYNPMYFGIILAIAAVVVVIVALVMISEGNLEDKKGWIDKKDQIFKRHSVTAVFLAVAAVFIILSGSASIHHAHVLQKSAYVKWNTSVTNWAQENYDTSSDFSDFKQYTSDDFDFFNTGGCYFGPSGYNNYQIVIDECAYGDIVVGERGARQVEKASVVKIGDTTILLKDNAKQVKRAEDAPALKTAKVAKNDDSIRGQYLPKLQDEYVIKDALIPSTDVDCDNSDKCYNVAFITGDDNLETGHVSVIGDQSILLVQKGKSKDWIEYNPNATNE
jgi:hypothetical protein